MSATVTIRLRNRKAKKLLQRMEELKLIEIMPDRIIPQNWSSQKKKRAKKFLAAYSEAKLAAEGKIKLKSAQSLLDEL